MPDNAAVANSQHDALRPNIIPGSTFFHLPGEMNKKNKFSIDFVFLLISLFVCGARSELASRSDCIHGPWLAVLILDKGVRDED